LAAAVLVLGTVKARADASVDHAQEAVWSCLADFARSLVYNTPLKVDAITEQVLRSCKADFNVYQRAMVDSPERRSPAEIETLLKMQQVAAESLVGWLWDQAHAQQAVRSQTQTGRKKFDPDDSDIWINPGLTEEKTAEARRPRLFLPATVNPSPLP